MARIAGKRPMTSLNVPWRAGSWSTERGNISYQLANAACGRSASSALAARGESGNPADQPPASRRVPRQTAAARHWLRVRRLHVPATLSARHRVSVPGAGSLRAPQLGLGGAGSPPPAARPRRASPRLPACGGLPRFPASPARLRRAWREGRGGKCPTRPTTLPPRTMRADACRAKPPPSGRSSPGSWFAVPSVSSAARQSKAAARTSWPSATISAATVMASPTTRLTAKSPSGTEGRSIRWRFASRLWRRGPGPPGGSPARSPRFGVGQDAHFARRQRDDSVGALVQRLRRG